MFAIANLIFSKEKVKTTKGQQNKKEQKPKDYKEPSQKWKQLDLVVDVNEHNIRYNSFEYSKSRARNRTGFGDNIDFLPLSNSLNLVIR